MKNRLFVPITKELLPQVKERYPFLYLERGRLEIDDSSVKWLDANKNIVRIPVSSIMTILLGPGTSVTHEAIKICSAANCMLCWVGTDSMLYYAVGLSPTSNTRKIKKQASLSVNNKSRLEVAKRMFSYRFPNDDITNKTLNELMGMEGKRVKALYEKYSIKYNVGWKGRNYIPGKFQMSDITNKILTAANTALYAVLLSCIFSLGYSPYFGFIHSGSPLPFVYDIADLYKEKLTIELAFELTYNLAGEYNREVVSSCFIERLQNEKLFSKIAQDIKFILEGKK